MKKPISVGTVLVAALAILALNIFWLSPLLNRAQGVGVANAVYILTRIAVLIGIGFCAARFLRKNRFQTISLAAFVEFVDQVGFRTLALHFETQKDPAAWQGVSTWGALYGTMMSFILFFPIIFILTFLGSELGLHRLRQRSDASRRS